MTFSALRPKSALTTSCVVAVLLCVSIAAYGQRYSQTNLVSDIQGEAAHTDPNLVNPWGVTFNATGPFWVADNGKAWLPYMTAQEPRCR